MPSDPRPAIRSFLADLAGSVAFADTDDLVRAGVVHSMRLLELIDFVSDRFGVTITADDVARRRLATVDAIATLVEDAS